MIEYLRISNFGPIKDEVEISFEATEKDSFPEYEVEMPDGKKLLKLAYIYGPNASGKTTILQALEFLGTLWRKPATVREELIGFSPFALSDKNEKTTFELAFYIDGKRLVYQLELNNTFIISEELYFYKTVRPTKVFSRMISQDHITSKIQFGPNINISSKTENQFNTILISNNSVVGAYSRINVQISILDKLKKWASTYMLPMVRPDYDLVKSAINSYEEDPSERNWIINYLKQADKTIDSFEIIGKTEATYDNYPKYDLFQTKLVLIKHKIGEATFRLTIDQESRGTKRYFGLGMILYALIERNYFFGIDELENSFHIDLTEHFILTFLLNSKNESQLLFTTHNINFLEDKELIRRDALWFTEKNEEGATELFSAMDFDSSVLRKGQNVAKVYKAGNLGAKPNLGSPLIFESNGEK